MCVLYTFLGDLSCKRWYTEGEDLHIRSASLRFLLSVFRFLLYQGLEILEGILFSCSGAIASSMLDIEGL